MPYMLKKNDYDSLFLKEKEAKKLHYSFEFLKT